MLIKSMKVVWSRQAEKQFAQADSRYRQKLEEKIAQLGYDRTYQLDIKKLVTSDNLFRLRVGDYRVIFTVKGEAEEYCYIVAIKRRSSTTYLHEESAHYERCSVY